MRNKKRTKETEKQISRELGTNKEGQKISTSPNESHSREVQFQRRQISSISNVRHAEGSKKKDSM